MNEQLEAQPTDPVEVPPSDGTSLGNTVTVVLTVALMGSRILPLTRQLWALVPAKWRWVPQGLASMFTVLMGMALVDDWKVFAVVACAALMSFVNAGLPGHGASDDVPPKADE